MAFPFATPDFGAGASILGLLALIWVAVILSAVGGILWGVWLLGRGTAQSRRKGLVVLLVSALVPLSCGLGPSVVFRLTYGRFPLSGDPRIRVSEGMSAERVRALLGEPHERTNRPDGEGWYYYQDSYGIYWFCVDFGLDRRVKGTHGH